MVHLTFGNLLQADAQALVNTVNTEGVMGKGIALQFKQAYPAMYKAYEQACKNGEMRLGHVHVYDLGGLVGGPRWIVNFPTKGHWRAKSKLSDIQSGLDDLVAKVRELKIGSIAVPPLGCGLGGLEWDEVRPLIEAAFSDLREVDVLLFPPNGAPPAGSMLVRTERPSMTPGRAALIAIADRYRQGMFDPNLELLELHKLMYFLQEAGQPLRLKYEKKPFGPYAENLRQVLIRLDGHYISGYGAGSDNPRTQIEILDGAVVEASEHVAQDQATMDRIERVAKLIEGFEDPYGLELLSTVHWVMCHTPAAREDVDAMIDGVQSWSERKKRELKPSHLSKAWDRLRSQQWHSESRSAMH
jgi:O-acetyl-ADP-ribose deacetylase (regulator of RNase III)